MRACMCESIVTILCLTIPSCARVDMEQERASTQNLVLYIV